MDQLEMDARAFLSQRGAPATPGNLDSIKTFLQMNPEKRNEIQASAPRSLLPAGSDNSSSMPADALDAAVIKSMQPREGNTNVAQQRVLKKKTGLSNNVQGLDMQGLATDPATQPATSKEAVPGNVSDAPAAVADAQQPLIDPNNPPDAMAGTTTVGDIGSVIEKLLGAGAVGAGAIASRGRAKLPIASMITPAIDTSVAGMKALPPPTTGAIAAPTTRAIEGGSTKAIEGGKTPQLQSPSKMVRTDPNLDEMQGRMNVQSVRQETAGRASPLKEEIKKRNRSKAKDKKSQ